MRKKELLNLLYALGVQPVDIIDNWVQVSCPLADVNHISGKDANPSAGFSINNKGKSVFHCFVCGTRSMESILNTYKWKRGLDLIGDYLRGEVTEQEEKVEYSEKFGKKVQPIPVPENVLSQFKPIDYAKEYLSKRGINLEIARDYGLKYCERLITAQNKIWKNAILTPIRDKDFKTYWLHFRSIDSKFFWHGQPKHFNLNMEWGRQDSFFGMEYLDVTKPVILVEGAFDVLRLKTLGLENVVATHGGINHKSKKIKRLKNLEVICGFDADEAGHEFANSVERFFNKKLVKLDWKKVGCKDPGEIKSKEDLDKVLNTKQENFKFPNKWRH